MRTAAPGAAASNDIISVVSLWPISRRKEESGLRKTKLSHTACFTILISLFACVHALQYQFLLFSLFARLFVYL